MKKSPEELLEAKRRKKNFQNVVEFKSKFFEILFQGRVDEVPGMTFEKFEIMQISNKPMFKIFCYLYEESFELWFKNTELCCLENFDLFDSVWSINCLHWGDEVSLEKFFEVCSCDFIQSLGISLISLKESYETSKNVSDDFFLIHQKEKSESSLRDKNWYYAESEYLKQKLKMAKIDFLKKLSEQLLKS